MLKIVVAGAKSLLMMMRSSKREGGKAARPYQFTHLLAQQLLAKASGLALKAKPIPSI